MSNAMAYIGFSKLEGMCLGHVLLSGRVLMVVMGLRLLLREYRVLARRS
jgi:hypothetical protein